MRENPPQRGTAGAGQTETATGRTSFLASIVPGTGPSVKQKGMI